MYSYDDLFLFAKVVEVGSFIHTSKLLNTTHTTISRRIKTLEEQLGVTLLKVDTRNFEITEIGKLVYAAINKEANIIDERIKNIVEQQNEPTGLIKVQLPIAMSQNIITPKIPGFLRKYPKVKLTICYQNTEVDLIKDGFDLALVNYIPKQQSLKIKNVFTTSFKLYCTRAYAQRYGVPKTLEELSNHMVTGIMLEDKTIPSNLIITNIKTKQETVVTMPNRIVINNETHMIKLLHSNEVICGIFDFEFNYPRIEREDIIPVLPNYALTDIKFYLIRHPLANDIKVQLFSEFLENCLKSVKT